MIEVLRGADNARIRSYGHQQLSTYGLGEHLSYQEWISLFRQLIHLGYLEQDIANYSVLSLTEAARPLLRGEKQLQLAKPRIAAKAAKPSKQAKKHLENDEDKQLFEQLRRLRKQIADEANVPPFVVFSDASLVEMVKIKPKNELEFLSVNGVGQRKLESYGDEFLHAIAEA